MTTKRPDYTEARNYYIKGEKNEYPTLQDIATEFNYSLSTLRKQAANEGWLKKRKERLKLKQIINMRKEFMGKATKLTNVSLNAISAAEYIINQIKDEQKQIELGSKVFDVHLATKQIWALNNAMKLVEKGNETLDEIENGYMSPFSDIGYL
ncbi:hypothetical protein OAZ15_04240 [Pelagibacteraceae bacterium]|nr:hypothetical protein [Pelagibacteraceae bacterium]